MAGRTARKQTDYAWNDYVAWNDDGRWEMGRTRKGTS